MNDMVERVAEAIQLASDDGAYSMLGIHDARKIARAAIEAMREPTDGMRTAVENDACIQGGLDDCNQHDIPDEVWRLMIEAALGKIDA